MIDYYTPHVPEDAPEWVSTYIRYFRWRWVQGEYTEQATERIDLGVFNNTWIYAPLYAAGAPILYTSFLGSASSGMNLPYYIIDGRVRNLNVPHMESDYTFMQDARGQPVAVRIAYSGSSWDRKVLTMNERGFQHWFSMGFVGHAGAGDGGYAYVGAQIKWFDTEKQAEAWIERQRAALMQSDSLDKWSYIRYEWPETSTWAEMEPELVAMLYEYVEP